MKLRSILFFLSVMLLVVSVMAVMVVLKLVVVPHIQQQAHVATVCKVTGMTRTSACITVSVTFLSLHGNVRDGYLRAKEDEGQDYFSTHPQCFCADCVDDSVSYSGTHMELLHHGKSLRVGSTTSCYFKTAESPKKLSAVAMHAGSYSTHVTMHAIIWPTVAFVVGFVAVFFSLIYVCRDWEMDFSDMDFCIYVTGVVDA